MQRAPRLSIAHRHSRASMGAAMNSPSSSIIDLTSNAGNLTKAVTNNNLYKELQVLEEQDGVISNEDFIFCVVCDKFVDAYDGIYIRECLHQICIDCARKKIVETTGNKVKCPTTECELTLRDGEIRALLTPHEYEMFTANQNNNNNEQLYKELLDLEKEALIHNVEPFECSICMSDTAAFDGIHIRQCLHQFCFDCVRNTIIHSEEAEIPCPAEDCECYIEDREIRSLLVQAEYDMYCLKGLRIAESKSTNSYHCKKENCEGWCIVEDAVNFFPCPRCGSLNCLTCQAIHMGMNCKQYQDELALAGMNDDQRSEFSMDEIVRKGEGMRCTTCKIIIMKREGCDGIMCSMCKTELCWATKMARWGPKGRGDTSGGCRCRVNGKMCHIDCRNCH